MIRKAAAVVLIVLSLAATSQAQTAQEPAKPSASASQVLIDILKDDTARAQLIAQLEASVQPAEPPPDPQAAQTVAQQIVAQVTGAVSATVDVVEKTTQEMAVVANLVRNLQGSDWRVSADAVTLFLVMAAVLAASLLGKLALDAVIRRNRITALTSLRRRLVTIVTYAALRLVSLAMAWGAGYVTAVWRHGGSAPSPTEAIFLTTVMVFGLCRIALRMVITPSAETEPSFSNLHPRAQETVYRALRRLIAATTFSFMFVLPLVREWVGIATVRPVRTVLATLLMVMAIVAIRGVVRVLEAARDRHDPTDSGTAAMLSRGVHSAWRAFWPPVATVYVIYSWLIAVTRPRDLGSVVLGGTVYSVVAVLLALAAFRLLRAASTLDLSLPAPVERVMPDLSRRFSGVMRLMSGLLAVLLLLGALLTGIAAWGGFQIDLWLSDPTVQQVLWRLVSAVLVAAFLALLWAVIASVVDQRLRSATMADTDRARSRTLLGLFRNAFTILVAVLGTMVVLSQLGIDIAPLLAGAGVIGLAIGFGSQKLVQDIINGVFIQMENAINQGDVVGVAGITGSVEKLTLRSVRLRTVDGAVHIVPFSSVDMVTNLTRDYSYHVAEIGVAYKEKIPAVIDALQAAFSRLRAEPIGADITEDLEVHGVTSLGDSAVVVRVRIKTRPGKQWGIGREFTALAKEEMDARGIEIPYPHTQIVLSPDVAKLLAKRPGDDARVIDS